MNKRVVVEFIGGLLFVLALFFASSAFAQVEYGGTSGVASALNVAMRANSNFGKLDEATQQATFAAMGERVDWAIRDIKTRMMSSSYMSWFGAMSILRSRLPNAQYGSDFSASFVPIAEGGTWYLDPWVGSDHVMWAIDQVMYVAQPPVFNTDLAANKRDIEFSDGYSLSGDMFVDSQHFQCRANSGNERVYGKSAINVVRACAAADTTEITKTGLETNLVCSVTSARVTCKTPRGWSPALEWDVEYASGGNPVACPFGQMFVATSGVAGSTEGSCTIGRTVNAGGDMRDPGWADRYGPGTEKTLPLSDEMLALLGNVLWQSAALQPGYLGAPYLAEQGLTPQDVAKGLSVTGLESPAYSEFSKSAQPAGTPGYPGSGDHWAFPTTPGAIGADPVPDPDPNPDPGGEGFDGWIERLKAILFDIGFVIIAIAATFINIFVVIKGVKLVVARVRD